MGKDDNVEMVNIMSKRKDLFLTFFKIGLFTFGGGYAMIPLIEKEAVDKKQWLSSEELLDVIAIAESTPGPIALNAATFIGKKSRRLFGGFMCNNRSGAPVIYHYNDDFLFYRGF